MKWVSEGGMKIYPFQDLADGQSDHDRKPGNV